MRIIVTGSRNWPYPGVVHHELRAATLAARQRQETVTVVHGDCPTGADEFARRWTYLYCPDLVTHEPHTADWKRRGKAAGPARNQHMVDLGADLVLAFQFNGSPGTGDCIRRAAEARLRLRVVELRVSGVQYEEWVREVTRRA